MSAPLYTSLAFIANGATQYDPLGLHQGPLAPYGQDYLHGYDSVAGRLSPQRREAVLPRANCIIYDKNTHTYFPLFVHSVNFDLALAGTTAQSQMTRDFYPHNMVMPDFSIVGQSYDQASYSMLCEFVHQAQQGSLRSNNLNHDADPNKHVLQLYIAGGGIQGHRAGPTGVRITFGRGFAPPLATPGTTEHHSNQTVRGSHQPIHCLGFVKSIPRKHAKAEYAPIWTLGFEVVNMASGPYIENGLQTTKWHGDWHDLLQGKSFLKTDKALLATNKANLKFVADNSINILSDGNGGTTGTGGSAASGGTATGTVAGGVYTVKATYFSPADAGGSPSCGGDFHQNNGFLFAELGVAGARQGTPLGPLFGTGATLPCGFKLKVTNPATGQSAIAIKADIGGGAPGASIDLWIDLSNAIGFTNIGSGNVQIQAVK